MRQGARVCALFNLVAALLLLAGCAGTTPQPVRESAVLVGSPPLQGGWWQVGFLSGWGRAGAAAEGGPPWHLDVLLADRVLRPIIDAHRGQLGLWRFHRRAAQDATGHRFSFLFYAPREVAEAVDAALDRDPLLAALLGEGKLVMLEREGLRYEALKSDLAGTSDPSWPPPIQRSWPWFIMGVSAHWLALIAEVQTPDVAVADGLDGLLGRYRDVSATVDELWQVHAQHAYLHHLNGVFGYQPLLLRERTLKRF